MADPRKLVRDRIGDIPWHVEDSSRLGQVSPDSAEYRDLLRAKLLEEATELLDADRRGDPKAVLEEAADVFEVLRALLVANGRPVFLVEANLADAAAMKRALRGGLFLGRTYTVPEGTDG